MPNSNLTMSRVAQLALAFLLAAAQLPAALALDNAPASVVQGSKPSQVGHQSSFVDANWPAASDGLQPLLAATRTGAPDPYQRLSSTKTGPSGIDCQMLCSDDARIYWQRVAVSWNDGMDSP